MIAGTVTIALVYMPAVPIFLRALGINPYLAIVNIMACRVFRKTRDGVDQGITDINERGC